jgi:hypothetical protein
MDSAVSRTRSRLAVAHRLGGNITEARRDFAAAKLEDFISKTLAAAPTLTDEQRSKLALLIHGSTPRRGTAA